MWQHVKLSVQIRPWDTLVCCWDVKQPTNKQISKENFYRLISTFPCCQSFCPSMLPPSTWCHFHRFAEVSFDFLIGDGRFKENVSVCIKAYLCWSLILHRHMTQTVKDIACPSLPPSLPCIPRSCWSTTGDTVCLHKYVLITPAFQLAGCLAVSGADKALPSVTAFLVKLCYLPG